MWETGKPSQIIQLVGGEYENGGIQGLSCWHTLEHGLSATSGRNMAFQLLDFTLDTELQTDMFVYKKYQTYSCLAIIAFSRK